METVTGQPNNANPQGKKSLQGHGTDVTEVKDDFPQGLKELVKAKQVIIKQCLDVAEAVLCWQRPCRYSLYNTEDDEDHFLYAQEVSACYLRQCLGAMRGFVMKFSNAEMQDVMRLQRPLRCPCGICWWWCCCHQELAIESPPGNPIGRIEENRMFCCPRYEIIDDSDRVVFHIEFSCCLCKLCADVSIQIFGGRHSDEPVAEITKACHGNSKDCCGTENNFILHYLTDLDVQDKILLLGASFLIDYNFFERQQRSCC
ncbi:phospholipid scramblase 1-like [Mizuhopecten yessoensis]|uniref:phospholipid scramblase 1-like n=1 Tax=Mizuhopecten yessoensis TaxID=6573 RepID=UPI000B45890A|nr:phospholipid scramblase 1-like [Mizuhopecten yessoensis]XP_021361689.1 phospholipid scramblase 1-like [Mizuhopecten yessoensis]XP_021361698.1 phospholipid scramblase 1-like [Mizuhopecten yessoensis]XP_021361706.1 phospholipid scramblase 1-like [Mizuhopecten yessoensis]